MMIDINKFKKVNDALGHLKGDEMLIHVAKIIKNNIRTSDILGRYGGEEWPSILHPKHDDCDGFRCQTQRFLDHRRGIN